jgi:S1-C subfamily serine protease
VSDSQLPAPEINRQISDVNGNSQGILASQETLATKLSREAQLISAAASDAYSVTSKSIKEHPEHLVSTFAASAVGGAGLALLQRRAGWMAVSAEVIGASLAVPMLIDSGKRAGDGFRAINNTFNSKLSFEADRRQLSSALGSLTTDFVAATTGGLLGVSSVRLIGLRSAMNTSVSAKLESQAITGGRVSANSETALKPGEPIALEPTAKSPIFDINRIDSHPDKATADLYWKAWPSIIKVETSRASGDSFATGFLVSDKGHVATAFHAIADAERVRLYRADGTKVSAQLEAIDPGADLAIFKIDNTVYKRHPVTGRSERTTEALEALPLASTELPIAGAKVANMGYAKDVENVGISTGQVKQIVDGTIKVDGLPAPFHADQAVVNTSVSTRGGFSGGPLLNESGEVVGLHSAGDRVSNGYDIPVSAIMASLHNRDLRRTPEFWRGIVPLIKNAQRSPEADGGFASDLSSIYAGQHPRVFKIKAISSKSDQVNSGTGLLLSDQNHYVTSAKLVEGAKSIQLNENGIWSRHLSVVKVIPESGLAILHPSMGFNPYSKPPVFNDLLLGSSAKVQEKQTIVAMGYPAKLFELHASVGQLDRFAGKAQTVPVGKLSMPTDPGLEGAPLFNRKGQLVGIGTTSENASGFDSINSLTTRGLLEVMQEIAARSAMLRR